MTAEATPPSQRANPASGRVALTLAAMVLATLAVIQLGRPPVSRVWADEGTYLAMAKSLAFDHDLRFDERDRARLEAEVEREPGAGTVILQRARDGVISYSKPALFPLLAAPFVAVAGDAGSTLLNLLLLVLALAVAYRYLRRLGTAGRAALVLATFAGAAVVVPYVFWRMGDMLQLALATIGFTTSLAPLRRSSAATDDWLDRPGAQALGAACLGLLVPMRLNNLLLAAVPSLAYVAARRPRRAAAMALATALPALAGFGLTAWATGVANPYRAERTSFTVATGYPAGAGAESAAAWFDDRPATHRTGLRPDPGPDRIGYAALYFWIGRHTGLLFYFPAVAAFLLAAFRRPDAVTLAALAGFFGSAAFLVGWMPWNYFGGHTFLGNRYILAAYPALLVAPRGLPRGRTLTLAWLLAATAYGSALLSVHRTGRLDETSQSHTHAGIFRLLPYESTARDLASRDRYWAGSFVRFVDPYAEPGAWHFVLEAGRPAAELIVAQWQDPSTIRFLVETDAAEATLVAVRGGERHRFDVGRAARPGSHAVLDLPGSKPWRRHRFWWYEDQRYWVDTLRLALETPGPPARATVRFLGDPEALMAAFAAQALAVEGPRRGAPGATAEFHLRVRNDSQRIWPAEDTAPVIARYRFRPADDPASLVREGPPTTLGADVPPGGEASLTIPVTWPETPGRYLLDLDLVLARIAWFADRTGAPLARLPVEVVLDPSPVAE